MARPNIRVCTPRRLLGGLLILTAALAAAPLGAQPAVTITYTGPSGGSWNVATNWDLQRLPLPADHVGLTTDVLFGSGSAAVQTLQSGLGTLFITGGTLNTTSTADGSSLASLDLGGGTLGGAGGVALGNFAWSGGSMGGSGATAVAGSATLAGDRELFLSDARVLGLDGNTTWVAGTASHAGRIGLPAAPGALRIGASGVFTDQGAGTASGERFIAGSLGAALSNAGIYVRNGLGTTSVSRFDNTGTVQVNQGTLLLASGTSSGELNIAGGATLSLRGAAFELQGGTLSNAGTLEIASQTILHAGAVLGGNGAIAVNGGLLKGMPGSSAVGAGSLTLAGAGLASLAGPAQVGLLEIESGILSGAGTVTAGSLAWTSGAMGRVDDVGGITTVNGPSTLSGAANLAIRHGRILNLNGDATWSAGAGSLTVSGDAGLPSALNIGADATFVDAGAPALAERSIRGAFSTLHNAGRFVRNGLGSTEVHVGVFTNAGTVTVNAGALLLHGFGSSSGALNIASGATLRLAHGAFDVEAGTLSNAGTLAVSDTVYLRSGVAYSGNGAIAAFGGVLTSEIATPLTPASLSVSGDAVALFAGAIHAGTLALDRGWLDSPLVTASSLAWNGGTMAGGVTSVDGPSVLAGTAALAVRGHTVNLNGDIAWEAGSGGLALFSDPGEPASVLNIGAAATFTDAGATAFSNKSISGNGTLNNAGTYARSGLGTTVLDGVAFVNTGTVHVVAGSIAGSGTYVQNAGVTIVDGLLAPSEVRIAGGLLQGSGIIGTTVAVDGGAVAPGNSPGTLTIGADLLFDDGILLTEIAGTAAGQFDLLAITGSAVFGAGTLAFSFIDGFVPHAGDQWLFLTAAGGVSGMENLHATFSGAPALYRFGLSASEGGMLLTVAAVPEPRTYALMLAGLALLGFAARRRLK